MLEFGVQLVTLFKKNIQMSLDYSVVSHLYMAYAN